MHAEHALEATRAKPYSAGENHSFGQNSATKPGERSIPRTSGADDRAQKSTQGGRSSLPHHATQLDEHAQKSIPCCPHRKAGDADF
mgnify:CR=1 FL=1